MQTQFYEQPAIRRKLPEKIGIFKRMKCLVDRMNVALHEASGGMLGLGADGSYKRVIDMNAKMETNRVLKAARKLEKSADRFRKLGNDIGAACDYAGAAQLLGNSHEEQTVLYEKAADCWYNYSIDGGDTGGVASLKASVGLLDKALRFRGMIFWRDFRADREGQNCRRLKGIYVPLALKLAERCEELGDRLSAEKPTSAIEANDAYARAASTYETLFRLLCIVGVDAAELKGIVKKAAEKHDKAREALALPTGRMPADQSAAYASGFADEPAKTNYAG